MTVLLIHLPSLRLPAGDHMASYLHLAMVLQLHQVVHQLGMMVLHLAMVVLQLGMMVLHLAMVPLPHRFLRKLAMAQCRQ